MVEKTHIRKEMLTIRLWHYKLIPYLPNKQLRGQWRELNSIFKKQDKHILINYIYEYPKEDLYIYTARIISEMHSRGFKIKVKENALNYFGSDTLDVNWAKELFKNHHDFGYLEICYYNLKEKYLRGQSDFDTETFEELDKFYSEEYTKDILKNCIKVDLKKRRKNENIICNK